MTSIAPSLDRSVLALTSTALLFALCVFGLEPAFQIARPAVLPYLRNGVGAAPSPPARQRAILRWQVATSTAFLLIAFVSTRAAFRQASHDTGFALDQLTVAAVDFGLQGRDPAQSLRIIDEVVQKVRRVPGVQSVSASSGFPIGVRTTPYAAITPIERPFKTGINYPKALVLTAQPGLFETLGVAVVKGRAIDSRDADGHRDVAVLSQRAAETLFGRTDPVGRQFSMHLWRTLDGDGQVLRTLTVVGVARDTDVGEVFSRDQGSVYPAAAQLHQGRQHFIMRSRLGSGTAKRVLQAAISDADNGLAVARLSHGLSGLAGPFEFIRMLSLVAVALGLLTLTFAMVGLYATQTQEVQSRTGEFGIRLALGATPRQLRRMVLFDGALVVVSGLAIGLCCAMVVKAMLNWLVGAETAIIDLAAFTAVSIPLLSAAVAACFIPAVRASRVDPNLSLRAQ